MRKFVSLLHKIDCTVVTKPRARMATLIAAGAASCAGYFLGSIAMRDKRAPNTPRFVNSTVPRSFLPASVARGGGHATTVAPPKRCVPGQCMLCESWFQHGDVVAKLYCGHVLHRTCLETVCRQPVYEQFRCTCPGCRGLSWVTRFAVTQLQPPVEPSVPPLPVPAPPRPPAPPPTQPAPPQRMPAPARSPSPPPLSDKPEEEELHAESEPVTPFCVSHKPARNTGWPSCSLCTCAECALGGDGNCDTCGRCTCYACTYHRCECCCRCVVHFPKK